MIKLIKSNGVGPTLFIILFIFSISYPCEYGGKIDNKVYTTGLEQFGNAVMTNVWDIIKENYIDNEVFFLFLLLSTRKVKERKEIKIGKFD